MKKIIISSFIGLSLAQATEAPTIPITPHIELSPTQEIDETITPIVQPIPSHIKISQEQSSLTKKISKTIGLSLAAAVTGCFTLVMGCGVYDSIIKLFIEQDDVSGTKMINFTPLTALRNIAGSIFLSSTAIIPLIAAIKLGIKIKNVWTKPGLAQLQNKHDIDIKLAIESASLTISGLPIMGGSIITGLSFLESDWFATSFFCLMSTISAWVAYDSSIEIKKLYQQKQSILNS